MTWDDWHKAELALTAYREARSEGRDGLRAVMHVIRNRVDAGWGDWDSVIRQPNQFSSMTFKGDSQLVVWPIHRDSAFEIIMQLVDTIYDGQDDDLTEGALYYYNPATATSQWFWDNVVTKMKLTVTVGHHQFFAPS